MDSEVADFVDRLESADTPADVWRLTLDHCARQGADWVLHGYASPLWHEKRGLLQFNSNIPAWWDQHRQEQDYRRHDPAVLHCLRSSGPLPFGLGIDNMRYSAPAQRMYMESADWGARCGVAFPMRNLSGSPLGGFVCITRLAAPEFKRWWPEVRTSLYLAALAVDARMLSFYERPEASVHELTARERECLLWLAAGLRTDRIAHRLGISNAAVDLHFANARRKLAARTRDQALLKAVMLGLLMP